MLDRVKQVPAKLLEIWNKYTKKQRAIILSTIAAIIFALLILIFIVGRTSYVYLHTFKDITVAAKVDTALTQAGINHKVENDNLTFNVDSSKFVEANFLITSDEFASKTGFSRDELLTNSMSTTNRDKIVKGNLYLMDDIELNLRSMEGVDDVTVSYNPNTDSTDNFLNPNKEIVCGVNLVINNNFRASSVDGIAYYVASVLGNKTIESITVIDQYGNLLFNGGQQDGVYYNSKRAEHEATVKNFINDSCVQTGRANNFDYVAANVHLPFDYSQESVEDTEYYAQDGLDQAITTYIERIESESDGTSANVVGTDPNDDQPDYYTSDTGTGPSSYTSTKEERTPSKRITTTIKDVGNALFDQGTLQVTMNQNRTLKESDWPLMAESATMTLEEYLFNYRNPVELTLSDDFYGVFSACSGIPAANISLKAYETLIFIPNESTPINWDLILKIILAVLIIGLLIFVVFRGIAPVEVTELEPELSVEKLLATTKENQSLDDIEFSEVSETRKLIERFVDENPEAVANLLRSWLEDDWD